MKATHSKEIYIKNDKLTDLIFTENCIFFDIETTGFSPKNSQLYLIGCAYKRDNQICVDQFLAQSLMDEIEVLDAFINILKDFDTIISFNGMGFDIPFLKAKCNQFDKEDIFSKLNYLDIFKSISDIKRLLKLENYKQKTIESFIGIDRDDMYSGGELINVFSEYIKSGDINAEELLLLHNYEDVVGMISLLPMLSYKKLLSGHHTISCKETNNYTDINGMTHSELIITLSNEFYAPVHLLSRYDDIYINIDSDITKLRIPIVEDSLCYFYPNYKDYYYLPAEDKAIHKSVAEFVDKNFREKCHAYNCYTRKTSSFIVQYEPIMNPAFKKEYKDKVTYFELTKDFCNSNELLTKYVNSILSLFLRQK